MIRNGKRWHQKPPVGYGIDRSHPLAAGLVSCLLLNENSGSTVFDLARPSSGTFFTSGSITPTWRPDQDGPVVDFSGAGSSNARIQNLTNPPTGQNVAFTIAVRFNQTGGLTGFQTLYGEAGGNLGLYLTSGKLDYYQSGDRIATGAVAVSGNVWHTGAVTAYGLHSNLDFYLDGAAYGTYTNPGSYDQQLPTASVGIGCDGVQERLLGRIAWVYIWNRALRPAEHASLAAAPYQFFDVPAAWKWMTVAAGGGPSSLSPQCFLGLGSYGSWIG